jgi:hypothetical protein
VLVFEKPHYDLTLFAVSALTGCIAVQTKRLFSEFVACVTLVYHNDNDLTTLLFSDVS